MSAMLFDLHQDPRHPIHCRHPWWTSTATGTRMDLCLLGHTCLEPSWFWKQSIFTSLWVFLISWRCSCPLQSIISCRPPTAGLSTLRCSGTASLAADTRPGSLLHPPGCSEAFRLTAVCLQVLLAVLQPYIMLACSAMATEAAHCRACVNRHLQDHLM